MMIKLRCKTNAIKRRDHHELRDSVSHAATGFFTGKWQFLTTYRIDTTQPITKKLSNVITSTTPTAVPNLVDMRPRGGGFSANG